MGAAQFLKTALSFTKHIRTTGAFAETSRFVEQEMIVDVDPQRPQLIVEFGAGHGNITRAILARMHPQSRLVSFEIEPDFLPELRKLRDPRLQLENRSAGEVVEIVGLEQVDCVVSAIPVTIMPVALRRAILMEAQRAMKPGTTLRQVLYSRRRGIFEHAFEVTACKLVMNVPPAFIHVCEKQTRFRGAVGTEPG